MNDNYANEDEEDAALLVEAYLTQYFEHPSTQEYVEVVGGLEKAIQAAWTGMQAGFLYIPMDENGDLKGLEIREPPSEGWGYLQRPSRRFYN